MSNAPSKNKQKSNPKTVWFGLVFGFALALLTEEDPYL